MRGFMRRLRGAFGIALTWGVAWAVAGAIVAAIIGWFEPPVDPNIPLLQAELLRAATVFGIIGFLNGIAFSIALGLNERRRSFNDLSPSRVVLWGLVGGVSYPALFALSNLVDGIRLPNDFLVAVPICAVFGAFSAWSILSIAKRAKDGNGAQLGAGTAPEFRASSRDRAAERA